MKYFLCCFPVPVSPCGAENPTIKQVEKRSGLILTVLSLGNRQPGDVLWSSGAAIPPTSSSTLQEPTGRDGKAVGVFGWNFRHHTAVGTNCCPYLQWQPYSWGTAGNLGSKDHRSTEQAELERTLKDHWVQLLALHSTMSQIMCLRVSLLGVCLCFSHSPLLCFRLLVKVMPSAAESLQWGAGNVWISVLSNVINIVYPACTMCKTVIRIQLLGSDVPHHANRNYDWGKNPYHDLGMLISEHL